MENTTSLSFNKRYLAIGTIIYILASYICLDTKDIGTITGTAVVSYSLCFAVSLIIIGLALCFILRKNRGLVTLISSLLIIVLLFILGYSRVYSVSSKLRREHDLIADNPAVSGVVTSVPELSTTGSSYSADVDIFELSSPDGGPLYLKSPIHAVVYFPTGSVDKIPNFGTSFKCSFASEISNKSAFDGDFDYSRYLMQKKICYAGYTYNYEQTDAVYEQGILSRLKSFGLHLRSLITKSCDLRSYGKDEQALLKGIMLGDVTGFSDELYAKYKASGLIHIASVSGMHTSYLFIVISFLLAITRLPRRYYVFFTIPVLVLFAAVALFTPSVCRAVIMLSALLFARFLGRQSDTITALAVSALMLVFENPYCLESYSFILSFCATLGILIYSYPIQKHLKFAVVPLKSEKGFSVNKLLHRLTRYITTSVSMSLAGMIGIAYFMARFFGSISFGGISGNILISPTVAISFIGGFLNCFVYYLSPAAADIIARFILNPALKFTNKVAGFFSKPIFLAATPRPDKVFFVIYVVICCYIYVLLTKDEKEAAKRPPQ